MSRDASKTSGQKRRKPRTGLFYTVILLIGALVSFAGGFWFTFRNWMVDTKTPDTVNMSSVDSSTAEDSDGTVDATDGTAAQPVTPAPMDPFGMAPLPSEAPTATPIPVATALPTPMPEPTAPTEEASQDTSTLHRVQVGEFEAREEADGKLEELVNQGFNQAEVTQDEDGLYHVQLNAFRKRTRAEAFVRKLATQGIDATIRP